MDQKNKEKETESLMQELGLVFWHEFIFSIAFSQKRDSVYDKAVALLLFQAVWGAPFAPHPLFTPPGNRI